MRAAPSVLVPLQDLRRVARALQQRVHRGPGRGLRVWAGGIRPQPRGGELRMAAFLELREKS